MEHINNTKKRIVFLFHEKFNIQGALVACFRNWGETNSTTSSTSQSNKLLLVYAGEFLQTP